VAKVEPRPVREVTRILVCSDAHHPYVDRLAWNTFLAAGHELRPDVLVVIGDFADAYSVSQHRKDPNRRARIQDELDACNVALDELDAFRAPVKLFCEGNHETRLPRYIADNAGAIAGLVQSIPQYFRLAERGWEWVPYQSFKRIGKVAFTHDVGRSGVNTARQSLVDFGGNLFVGHSHRGGVAYQGTVDHDPHFCVNVGWLGDLDSIDYVHKARAARDWQHGFGYATQTADGMTWGQFIPILNGRCVVDGRVITGRVAA